MLDIKYIRDHADGLKKAIAAKQLNPKIVDEVLRVDEERRQLIGAVEELRQQINEHAAGLKSGQPSTEAIAKGRQLKEKLKDQQPQLAQVEKAFLDLMYQVPNPAASDVPFGQDETGNKGVGRDLIRQIVNRDAHRGSTPDGVDEVDWSTH